MQLLGGCLYKYGPLEHLRRTLEDCTIGFSALKDFNDIHEYEYRITHYFDSIESEKILLEPKTNALSKVEGQIAEYLNGVRVSCFSRSPLSALMWSHYADQHRGICYCFQNKNDVRIFEDEKIEFGSVIYSSHVPEITVYQEQTTRAMLKAEAKDVILTKSSEWSYEQEVRFFGELDDPAVRFSPSALQAVIVGRRVNNEQIAEIEQKVQKFNQANECSARVLYSHRLATTFQFGVDSNKGYRDSCETNFNARIPVLPELLGDAVTSISRAED